jgi:hypothetical protein
MMTPAQLMMQKMLMEQQQQLQQNPIGQGTLLGMQAAKRSIQMDEADKNRAMGLGAFNMFSNMGNQNLKYGERPRDVFQQFSRALPHGVNAYLGEEERAKELNASLLARQMEQEQRRRHEQLKLGQMQYEMERDRIKDAENKAYNDRYLGMMSGRYGQKGSGAEDAGPKVALVNGKPIDLSGYAPIETGTQKNLYAKESKFWDHAYNQLKSIKPSLEKMKEVTEESTFAPFGSTFGHYPNVAKDYVAKVVGDKKLNEEMILRKGLISKFERLSPVLEKATKGGSPDVQLMKRFNDFKVYLTGDDPINVIEDRFNELLNEALDRKQSANLSVSTGLQINTLHGSEIEPESGSDEQAQIMQARQQYPGAENLSDEEVLRWLKAMTQKSIAKQGQQ